jgi:hypothetical protein
MNPSAPEQVRWTVADLDLLPDNGTRYEIIDGELFTIEAPRWSHQQIAGNICTEINRCPETIALGRAVMTPGILFSEASNVIPDVVWASYARLEVLLNEAEHLTGAPEPIVEVLSPASPLLSGFNAWLLHSSVKLAVSRIQPATVGSTIGSLGCQHHLTFGVYHPPLGFYERSWFGGDRIA